MLKAADLPYRMPTGEVLEDITPRETFETALEAFDIAAFRKRQEADRARGIYRGVGICNVVESTTYGSAFFKAAGIPGSGYEAGWVKVEPSGAVNASVGLMASGQGYETTFSQVVADALGVAPENVRINIGNTDTAPYGMGSRGARGGTVGGSVLTLAARAVRDKALAIAAAMLGLNTSSELRLERGRVERHLGGDMDRRRHRARRDRPCRLSRSLAPAGRDGSGTGGAQDLRSSADDLFERRASLRGDGRYRHGRSPA